MFFLFRAEPKPIYDPFDNLLRVDIEQLMNDSCWNPYGECVGPTLRYETDGFYIDYSIDGYEELDFVSNRIAYFPLDTLARKYFIEKDYRLRDTIPIRQAALARFASTIQAFDFEVDTIFDDSVRIISPLTVDTIILKQSNIHFRYDSLVIRKYYYEVETPLNFEQRVRRLLIKDYIY